MNCSCCGSDNINDLDNTFNSKRAQKEARRYMRKGLDKRSQKLIAYLDSHLRGVTSALDIGCGAGGVHHELLRRHLVSEVVGVDASSGYLAAAEANAKELGLADAVSYHREDFALSADQFMPADVVTMDRVICCYPHLQQLLGQAAEHSKQYLAISFPADQRWLRWPFRLADGLLTLIGSGYHPFLHPLPQILAVTQEAGLTLVHSDNHYIWRIMVFQRQA